MLLRFALGVAGLYLGLRPALQGVLLVFKFGQSCAIAAVSLPRCVAPVGAPRDKGVPRQDSNRAVGLAPTMSCSAPKPGNTKTTSFHMQHMRRGCPMSLSPSPALPMHLATAPLGILAHPTRPEPPPHPTNRALLPFPDFLPVLSPHPNTARSIYNALSHPPGSSVHGSGGTSWTLLWRLATLQPLRALFTPGSFMRTYAVLVLPAGAVWTVGGLALLWRSPLGELVRSCATQVAGGAMWAVRQRGLGCRQQIGACMGVFHV